MRNIILVVLMLGALTLTNCGKETIIERIEVQKGNLILSGSGRPAPSLGSVGDYYLDITTTELYGAKTENGWGTPINLKGLQGEKGEKGAKGEKGEKGDKGDTGSQGEKGDKGDRGDNGVNGSNGSNGVAGRDGTKIFSGNTTPDNSLGSVGDFYIDLTEKKLYGPKTDSGWGTSFETNSLSDNHSIIKTESEFIVQANIVLERYIGNGTYTIVQTDENKNIVNISVADNKVFIKGIAEGETNFSIERKENNYKYIEEIKIKVVENTGDYILSDNCQTLEKWENARITEIDMRNDKVLKNIKEIGGLLSFLKKVN